MNVNFLSKYESLFILVQNAFLLKKIYRCDKHPSLFVMVAFSQPSGVQRLSDRIYRYRIRKKN